MPQFDEDGSIAGGAEKPLEMISSKGLDTRKVPSFPS